MSPTESEMVRLSCRWCYPDGARDQLVGVGDAASQGGAPIEYRRQHAGPIGLQGAAPPASRQAAARVRGQDVELSSGGDQSDDRGEVDAG